MKIHELNVIKKQSKRRDGRGISAGRGKTAGRGTKGQKSRAGSSKRPGFEGGQTPLMQRLPKLRGFTSHRIKTQNVTTAEIDNLSGEINTLNLFEQGLINSAYNPVKLIVKGDITKKHIVKLQGISENAQKMIESKGGTFTSTPRLNRPKKAKSETK